MREAYCICKLKHDIRVESKVDLARRETEQILGTSVTDLEVLPTLFRKYPFSSLDDRIIDRMTRLLYLGRVHGFIAGLRSLQSLVKLAKGATYLREIYAVLLTSEDELPEVAVALGSSDPQERGTYDENRFIDISPSVQVFNQRLDDESYLTTVLSTPIQTLLEYASEVVKLPYVTFTRQFTDLGEKLEKMEKGVEKGLDELLQHLRLGVKRMPWLGLFKDHIGDYVDWAFSDFRTWGLHFIHKHEGKADPWLARSCLNMLGVEEGCTVLDPFCGSGTFLADAPFLDINAVGIDINPLSTMISRVKCNLVNIPLTDLRQAILKLDNGEPVSSNNDARLDETLARLETKDKTRVLGNGAAVFQILSIKDRIDELSSDPLIKDFLYTMLSRSIVGLSSKQKKNKAMAHDFIRDAVDFYLYAYASQKILSDLGVHVKGRCTLFTNTAWSVNTVLDGKVDGIVTSPPYFDALDYHDSSSLPIALLGLDVEDGRLQDGIIGSRKRAASDADLFLYDLLPDSSQLIIRELLRVGREKKARIVLHYLNDMSDCLHAFFEALNEGRRTIFVVGKYHHWKLGNRNVQLDGAQALIDIGEQAGFTLEYELPHNISKIEAGNRIKEESIIIWRKGFQST
ncbi:MAG: hypothetical protein WED04_06610 [Promethearchaeati archaeon SRVP18_Atabeyarchaeia-1]